MEGVGGSLRAGEPSLLGVFGELFRPLNRRVNLPPRPVAALLNESSCAQAQRDAQAARYRCMHQQVLSVSACTIKSCVLVSLFSAVL